LPRVRDIAIPSTLGMHPAAQLPLTGSISPEIAALPPNTPKYVPRDIDRDLRAALKSMQFTLVIGDSTSGKTRSAYEAAQAIFPDYSLLNPAQEGLSSLLEADAIPSRCIIWLDDLQDRIGFISAPMIRRILEIPYVVVLATMRATEYDRYAPKEYSASTIDYNRESTARAWEVLSLAVKIRLNRKFSESERSRVSRCMDDPRVAEASSHLDEYGLAEYMAAGPRLLERWRNAWDVGGQPAGAAVVAAAVDCRRTGISVPLSQDLLRELYHYYLDERGGGRLRPESFDDALRWATERVYATSSLLIPTSDSYGSGFLAFDYLVEAAEKDSEMKQIPFAVWGAMIDYSEATTAAFIDAESVSWSSMGRRFSKLGRTDSAEDMFLLAVELERRRSVSEAVRWYREAAIHGHFPAAHRLGLVEHRVGNLSAAERWYRIAASTGDAHYVIKLGEFCYEKYGIASAESVWQQIKMTDTRNAVGIGSFLQRKGELPEAVTWYVLAVDRGDDAALERLERIVDHSNVGELAEETVEEIRLLRLAADGRKLLNKFEMLKQNYDRAKKGGRHSRFSEDPKSIAEAIQEYRLIIRDESASVIGGARRLAKIKQSQGAREQAESLQILANRFEKYSKR